MLQNVWCAFVCEAAKACKSSCGCQSNLIANQAAPVQLVKLQTGDASERGSPLSWVNMKM